MRKSLFAAAAFAMCAASVPAQAAGLLGALVGTDLGEAKVKGKQKKDGRIEVETSMPARAGQVEEVFMLGLVRIAEMTEAAGGDRFALVKIGKCGTLLINYSPVRHQCKLTGLPVADGETAQPLGKDEVAYFETANVISLRGVDPDRFMLALTLAKLGLLLPNGELDTAKLEAEPVLETTPVPEEPAAIEGAEPAAVAGG